MAFQKHRRMDMRAVRGINPKMRALLRSGRKHPKLIAFYAGHSVHVTVSSSPSRTEEMSRHCLRDPAFR